MKIKGMVCPKCLRQKSPANDMCMSCYGKYVAPPPLPVTAGPGRLRFLTADSFDSAIPKCPFGVDCKITTESHLSAFSHPYYTQRTECECDGLCKDSRHRFEFIHLRPELEAVPFLLLNTRDPTQGYAQNMSDQTILSNRRVDFRQNVDDALKMYEQSPVGIDVSDEEFARIRDWIRNIRPEHRCNRDVLLSCFAMGGLCALQVLKNAGKNLDWAIHTAFNKIMDSVGIDELDKASHVKMEMFVELSVREYAFKLSKEKNKAIMIAALSGPEKIQLAKLIDELKKGVLLGKKGAEVLEKSKQFVEGTVTSWFRVMDVRFGCNSSTDIAVRTDYTVFTVYGPHTAEYYGNAECTVMLNQTIAHHPDFYVVPNAASFYTSTGYVEQPTYPCGNRPWARKNPNFGIPPTEYYYHERFNPSVPRTEDVLTMEFIRKAHQYFVINKKNDTPFTLELLQEAWRNLDAHRVGEGHLPNFVPLSYFEKVVLKKSVYEHMESTPDGKLFLEWMHKNKGPDSVVKLPSDGIADVRNECFRFSNTVPALITQPHGFCFRLSPNLEKREIFIPMSAPPSPSGIVYIYFTAVLSCPVSGSTERCFFTTVTNTQESKGGESERKSFTFLVDGKNKDLVYFKGSPFEMPPSRPCCKSFLVDMFESRKSNGHFEIILNYGDKSITFGRSEASAAVDVSPISMRNVIDDSVRYISFTAGYGDFSIWDVEFTTERKLQPYE